MRADFADVYSWLDSGLSTLYLDALRTPGRGCHSPFLQERFREVQRVLGLGRVSWDVHPSLPDTGSSPSELSLCTSRFAPGSGT